MIGAGVAQRVGQPLLRDSIGGERGLFVQRGCGDIERHLDPGVALAPTRRQHGKPAGESEFLERGGPLEILQLWVNLPSRLKMTTPGYTGLQKDAIPSFTADEGRVTINLISGDWNGHRGPIESLIDVHMMTIAMTAGGCVTLPAPRGRNVFFYIVRGKLTTGEAFHLIEWNDDGDAIDIESVTDSLILFGHAEPLREPVVAHGPFVMNTREEIHQAIRDYEAGKFR